MERYIFTHLADGNINGRLCVWEKRKGCELHLIPREILRRDISIVNEFHNVVYILWYINAQRCYIGKSRDFKSRIQSHLRKRWEKVIVFKSNSTSGPFSESEIGALESKSLEIANTALKNTNSARHPFVSREEESNIAVFFKAFKEFVSFTGCRIFDEYGNTELTIDNSEIESIRNVSNHTSLLNDGEDSGSNEIPIYMTRNCDAKGIYKDGKVIVKRGSIITLNHLPHLTNYPHKLSRWKNWVDQNTIVEHDKRIVINDTQFDSPSAAGLFCCGGSDGGDAWKLNDGTSLKQYINSHN